jgi:flagellar basal-body rod modification protein FlgD
VTTITSTNTDLDIANLQLASTGGTKAKKELGQEDFLALMIQQLRNQDPLKPMENGEFIGQMAQFSTVSGIADMSKSLAGLTEASSGSFSGTKPLSGAVELPYGTSSAVVRVYSNSGELLRELPLGSQEAGLSNFTWDGTMSNGQPAPAGRYKLTAAIESPAGDTALTTYLASKVESVTLAGDGSGSQIRTDSGATVRLSQVKAVM